MATSRAKKRGTITTILVLVGVLIGGALYKTQVLEYAKKIPVLGEWLTKKA